jgi:menaquinone-dependent protoporphyrinogen oxidase
MQRPVAIFAGGPMGKGDEKEWQGVRGQLDKELAQFPWLTPISIELVGGKLDPTKEHFPVSLFTRWVPASDLRDWDAIRAWASALAHKLQAAAPL